MTSTPKTSRRSGGAWRCGRWPRTYGQEVIYSGPLYRSMRIKGDKIYLLFDHSGGLKTRDGAAPDHFTVIDQETRRIRQRKGRNSWR